MNKKKIHRSSTDRKICGVCGGLAEHFNIDPTLLRLIVVIVSILTINLATAFLIYLLCAFIIPSDKKEKCDNDARGSL